LTEPKNAIIKQYKKLFDLDKVWPIFNDRGISSRLPCRRWPVARREAWEYRRRKRCLDISKETIRHAATFDRVPSRFETGQSLIPLEPSTLPTRKEEYVAENESA